MEFSEYLESQGAATKNENELAGLKQSYFQNVVAPQITKSGGNPADYISDYNSQADRIVNKFRKAKAVGSKSISEYDDRLKMNIARSIGENLPVIGPAINIIDDAINKKQIPKAEDIAGFFNPIFQMSNAIVKPTIDPLIEKAKEIITGEKKNKPGKEPSSLEGMTRQQIEEFNQAKSRVRQYENEGIIGKAKEIGEALWKGKSGSIAGIAAGAEPYIPASKTQEVAAAISAGSIDAPVYAASTLATRSPVLGFAIPDVIRQVATEFRNNPEEWSNMEPLEKANYVVTAINRVRDAGYKGAVMGKAFAGTGSVVGSGVKKVVGEEIAQKTAGKALTTAVNLPTQAAVMTGMSGDWTASGYIDNAIITAALHTTGALQNLPVKGIRKGVQKVADKALEKQYIFNLYDIANELAQKKPWIKGLKEQAETGQKSPQEVLLDSLRQDRVAQFGDDLVNHLTDFTAMDKNSVIKSLQTPEGIKQLEKVYTENRILNDAPLTDALREKYNTTPSLMKRMVEMNEIRKQGKEGELPKEVEKRYETIKSEAAQEFYKLNGLDLEKSGYAGFLPDSDVANFKKFSKEVQPVINKIKMPDMVNAIYRSPYEKAFVEKEIPANSRTNTNIADYLSEIARFSPAKADEYNAASREIRGMEGKVKELPVEQIPDTLASMGISPEISKAVVDLVSTGKSKQLLDAQMSSQFKPIMQEQMKYLTPDEIDRLTPGEWQSFIRRTYFSPDGKPRTDIDPQRVSSMLKDYAFSKKIMSGNSIKPEDIESLFGGAEDKAMFSPKQIENYVNAVQQFAQGPKKLNAAATVAHMFEKKIWQSTANLINWYDKKIGGNYGKKILQMDALKNETTETLQSKLEGAYLSLFRGQPKKIEFLTDRIAGLEPEVFNKRLPQYIEEWGITPQDIEVARKLAPGLKRISDSMFDMAKQLEMKALKKGEEVDIQDLYREHYSPDKAQEKYYDKSAPEYEEYVKWLMDEGVASGKFDPKQQSVEQMKRITRSALESYKSNMSKHRWGTLEYAKELPDLPEKFLKDTRTRWLETFQGAANRFSEIMHYGEKYEKLNKAFEDFMVDAAVKLDKESAAMMIQSVQEYLRVITNKQESDKQAKKLVKAIGTATTIMKLPFVAISQINQFTAPLQVGGMKSWLRGLASRVMREEIKFHDPDGPKGWTVKDLFDSSGSAIQAIRNNAIHTESWSNKVTDAYLKYNGMYKMDGAARSIANASGWFFAEELNHQMNKILSKKNVMGSQGELSPEAQVELLKRKGGGIFEKIAGAKENTYLVRKMNEMGLDPATIISRGRNAEGKYTLTPIEQINAARSMEVETNYRTFAQNLPQMARRSPLMSMAYFFKSYSFNKWQQTKTHVLGEARRGNFFPMFYMAAVDFGLVAPVLNAMASALKGRKNAITKLSTGKDDNDQDYNSVDYALEMLSAAGVFGKWDIPYNMIKYKKLDLGPTEGDLRGLVTALGYTIDTGGYEPMLKWMASEIPGVGRGRVLKYINEQLEYKRGVKRYTDKGYDEGGAAKMYELSKQMYQMKKDIRSRIGLDKKEKRFISDSELNKAIQEFVKDHLHDLGIYD